MYKDAYLPETDELYRKPMPGLYAEDVGDVIPEAVFHNSCGKVENWKERILLPLMLRVIQEQEKRIMALENIK